jgi:hypothetical protein
MIAVSVPIPYRIKLIRPADPQCPPSTEEGGFSPPPLVITFEIVSSADPQAMHVFSFVSPLGTTCLQFVHRLISLASSIA